MKGPKHGNLFDGAMNRYETSEDLSGPGPKVNNLSPNGSNNYQTAASSRMNMEESDSPTGSHETLGMSSRETIGVSSRETLGVARLERDHPHEDLRRVPQASTGFDHQILDATFEEERKEKKPKQLPHGGILLSIFYGVILIVLGIAFPVKEALEGIWLQNYITAVFLVYLYGVGFIFLVVTEMYLVCKNRTKRQKRAKSPAQNISVRTDPGFINLGYDTNDKIRNIQVIRPVTLRQSRNSHLSDGAFSDSTLYEEGITINGTDMRSEARSETTLYIRIVVIVLGLAAMVYDGLLIKQLQEGLAPSACGYVTIFWPRYVHIAFLLAQCYFLFKHSLMNQLADKAIVRLGFMHVLATNINELIRAFISQTFNSWLYNERTISAVGDLKSNTTFIPSCNYEEDIMYRAAPYLYPCVFEYNFLAAALVYFMFTSLEDSMMQSQQHNDSAYQSQISQSKRTEINCQRTHKGLFFGIVFLAGTAVSVILFFSYMTVNEDDSTSLLIYQISDIALHGVLILAVLAAWISTGKLHFQAQIDIAFEDGVLLISMSLGILFNVFQLMPTVESLIDGERDLSMVLSLTGNIVAIVTGIVQTAFMIDMSCRYLVTEEEWEEKPGRGSIMFLLLVNLALWLLKSFQIRALELTNGSQDEAYGFLPWQLIMYSLIPLFIYYYLFSSACLARTWYQTYTNSNSAKVDPDFSPRHEKYSTPAKEFEFVRHRRVLRNSANRMDVDSIVSPVSDV